MGERFGKYELVRRIGVGGMAEVFVAKTHGAQGFVKHVVIKRILPAFNEDPDFVRMFINEAHLAARLQHANIVQIFDFDHVAGVYYIAMEWVDGTDLRRVHQVARRRSMALPRTLALHVGVETLKGLHYAHTRSEGGKPLGIVHRDISPHNLLLSFSGELKVTDFGIAKMAALASATNSGVVKGKLTYMSPEQLDGSGVDARTDLYALGVVIWELLTGQRLYQGSASEAELIAQVRRAQAPPVRSLAPDVPVELEAVVTRLLASRAEQRYATAAEALSDLSRFAGVQDSLEVARFLKLLLPGEAERGEREETQMLATPVDGWGGFEAPPDAPTHTHGEDPGLPEFLAADEVGVLAPPGGEGASEPSARPKEGEVSLAEAQPEGSTVGRLAPRGRPRYGLIVLSTLLAFSVSGTAAWLLAEQLGLASRPRPAPSETRSDVAMVLVETDPPGAALRVDGVSIAAPSPHRLAGARGTVLRLEARLGARRAVSEVRLGDLERTVLRLNGETAALQPKGSDGTRPGSQPSRAQDDPTPTPAQAPASAPVPEAADGHASPGPALKEARGKASRRTSRPSGKPRGQGLLDVVVAPWARVLVDGKEIGETPIRGHQIAGGSHRVELSNPEIGRRELVKIRVAPGQLQRIRRDWTAQ